MEVFGNTTSPSNDQLADLTHPKNLDFLQFAWGDVIQPVYLGSICPPSLLLDIVRINHLRALAMRGVASVLHTSRENNEDNDENNNMPAHADAQAILDHALAFSPEELADKNANERTRASWLLMGRVHQSAVVLYCILALQHVRLLPSRKSAAIERAASAHYDRLLLDLKEGFRQVHFKTCLFWPLVVAGARAARGSAFERAFITEQLGEAVKDIGSSMPVLARATLVRFWESGKTGWDECFDQPYIFVT
jgi:hypothetical protein